MDIIFIISLTQLASYTNYPLSLISHIWRNNL